MSKRKKRTTEERITIVQQIAEGKISQEAASRQAGVGTSTIRRWLQRYKAEGVQGLAESRKNRVYSEETKASAVKAYLSGEGSLSDLCIKYKIRDDHILRDWIKVYNSGKDFKRMHGGSRMKQGRETTQEERYEIVMACIDSGLDYGATAIRYNVSYQQVYTWVRKYKELGKPGLEDRRGQRKKDQAPRSEKEALEARIAQLEAENRLLRMERDLLKKVKELERRDAFLK